MRRRQLFAFAGASLFAYGSRAGAQQTKKDKLPRLAIVGGKLLRAGEAPLDPSVIVIEGARIVSIGSDEALAQGATRFDATGKIVSAGLIDPLTRVGITEIDLEESSRDDALHGERPIAAGFSTADGYNPTTPLVPVTRREGLTSVGVVPAAGMIMGQSAWADLAGDTPDEALVSKSLALHVLQSDYALGGPGKNSASVLYYLRELFDDASAYRTNKAAFERRQVRQLAASRIDLDVVVRVLDGKLPVVFHADRASDILNLLALIQSYKLKAVIASAAEGWKVGKELAAAKVPAIVYPLDHGPRDFAALGAREDNAALLTRAGVVVALSSGESHNARKLRQVAGNAVRAGMDHAAAIAAVTDAPARIFGIESHGSAKVGRIANLAVWTGDPFELATRVDELFIRGKRVSLATRQTALFEKYR